MSQTTSNSLCPTPSVNPVFSKDYYQYRVQEIHESDITNSLVVGSYGVLVVVFIQAVYALTRSLRTKPPTIFLSITVLALFASTTAYVVVTIINNEVSYLARLLDSPTEIWALDPFLFGFSYTSTLVEQLELYKDYTWLYQQASTATAMVNIILGDAIVWWRACVVWGHNRVIQALCGLFLLMTFVLGVLDATLGNRNLWNWHGGVVLSAQPGALFENNSFGIATCVLSLSTNLVATCLIAYKAWMSRRSLRGYMVAKYGGSQIEKLFAILIESGAVYCAIWSVVVAYQVSTYHYNRTLKAGPGSEVRFLEVFGVVMNSILIPMIAIYPMFIIVLVASNRSHMEMGLAQSAQPIPTSTHIGDAITTSSPENRQVRRSSVLLIYREHRESDEESMD
ncbi:hypothetical protein GSI_09810 [Ganoderma sinense ZZ0214-1]|uniref:Uncharacterized protein n=1 Tax=Ganoderma sinense ZZ0214-1 TaxID=1077348 RepID=A0A2G8S3D0_9APHY|nr:hypothetical protein GSI_09810 [Ganoderma sinense ZZ0214-1]